MELYQKLLKKYKTRNPEKLADLLENDPLLSDWEFVILSNSNAGRQKRISAKQNAQHKVINPPGFRSINFIQFSKNNLQPEMGYFTRRIN